jgi:hypothetical protein
MYLLSRDDPRAVAVGRRVLAEPGSDHDAVTDPRAIVSSVMRIAIPDLP